MFREEEHDTSEENKVKVTEWADKWYNNEVIPSGMRDSFGSYQRKSSQWMYMRIQRHIKNTCHIDLLFQPEVQPLKS